MDEKLRVAAPGPFKLDVCALRVATFTGVYKLRYFISSTKKLVCLRRQMQPRY